jgi:hypothetical protein
MEMCHSMPNSFSSEVYFPWHRAYKLYQDHLAVLGMSSTTLMLLVEMAFLLHLRGQAFAFA